jgi:hypothetical protein
VKRRKKKMKSEDKVYIPAEAFGDLVQKIREHGDKKSLYAMAIVIDKLNRGEYGSMIVQTGIKSDMVEEAKKDSGNDE